MAITNTKLTPAQTGEIVTGARKQSAFQQIVPESTTLTLGGERKIFLGNVAAGVVGEGEAKPASGIYDTFDLLPQKFASIFITTTENEMVLGDSLADAARTAAISKFASEFDSYVSGAKKTTGFGDLSLVTETVEGVSVKGLMEAVGVNASKGVRTTAIALSNPFYFSLLKTVSSSTDLANSLTGSNGVLPNLHGIPVVRYDSTVAEAYVGDFSMARWGTITNDASLTRFTEAIITDDAGMEHNLAQENKVAYRTELWYAFNYASIAAYTRVIAGTTSGA